MKRVLPELDRLKRDVRSKAEAAECESLIAKVEAADRRLIKLDEEVRTGQRDLLREIDGKCDATAGNRALELAAAAQRMVGDEAKVREAVAAQLSQLAAQMPMALAAREEARRLEERVGALDEQLLDTVARHESERVETNRRLSDKAELRAAARHEADTVAELRAELQARHSSARGTGGKVEPPNRMGPPAPRLDPCNPVTPPCPL